MTRIKIDVTSQSGDWPDISDLLNNVSNALTSQDVFDAYKGKTVEVSVVLADNAFVQDLNKKYRNKDKPTNVLSFPQNPGPEDKVINLGDVVLAYETVKAEAAAQHKEFVHHLSHLLVHGILHLLSYDHEDDDEATQMETLEIRILEKLGIKNPYLDIAD